jgi:hypothetical protein
MDSGHIAYRERRFPNGCVVVASLQGRGTWRHHADGTIYGLHGRAVKAPAHHGVDAQHLFTAMLDDLVATLPARPLFVIVSITSRSVRSSLRKPGVPLWGEPVGERERRSGTPGDYLLTAYSPGNNPPERPEGEKWPEVCKSLTGEVVKIMDDAVYLPGRS